MKRKSNKKVTIENLAGMIKRSFDEVHQKLNKLEKNDQTILKKLEGIVYRREFEELETRVKVIEEALTINPKK